MIGYDLDDTLAGTNFAMAGKIGLSAIFRDAKVLRTPDKPFIIITARPHDKPQYREATAEWVRKNQPNCKGIRYVGGGENQIIKDKARIIKELNLTDFYDNNPNIVRNLRAYTKANIHLVN